MTQREIKFRVWTGSKMEYDVVVGALGAYYAKKDPKDSASLNPTTIYPESAPVMQYTGLKDKNGKAVYEGDIVRVTENVMSGYEQETGIVAFRAETNPTYAWGWRIEWLKNPPQSLNIVLGGKCEVIGNVWENPSLLTL